MSRVLSLTPSDPGGAVRIVQITDTHLFAYADRTLLGVDTRKSFTSVLEAIAAERRELDFMVVTGDISQDYSAESYQYFAAEAARLGLRIFFLPGNHDDGPLMYRIFGHLGVRTDRQVAVGNWQLVFLNSEVYGAAHGWLQRSELEFLQQCARSMPKMHLMCLIHHLPRLVNSMWLDTQTLHNQQDFLAVASQLPSLRLVLCGHVHQQYDETSGGIRYLATPSTSIQFARGSADFMLSPEPPGWRYLTLYPDGRVETEVCRLPEGLFAPNFNSRGY